MGGESSRRVRPNIGFSRIISGVYSGSISHKVAHSHWHTQAQRITLSHRHGTPWHSTQEHTDTGVPTHRLAFAPRHLGMPATLNTAARAPHAGTHTWVQTLGHTRSHGNTP